MIKYASVDLHTLKKALTFNDQEENPQEEEDNLQGENANGTFQNDSCYIISLLDKRQFFL